jgi:SAM-dependent methyltransferase
MTTAKYDPQAAGWTEAAYADPAGYLARRAELLVELGPQLQPGDTVLDLACGDAGLADPLVARGLRYVGVDLSQPMVEAARRRVAGRAEIRHGDLNDYEPGAAVAAVTCFRAIYYANDRRAFFARIAGFTERKVVFDLNPRQYGLDDVRADLRSAGFDRLDVRPFFAPQGVRLPAALGTALRATERLGPLARLALRFRFTYMCAASRETAARRS